LTVNISYQPKPEQEKQLQQQGKDHDEVMHEGIQKALLSIKNLCEGTGGKVESKAASKGNKKCK